jgi:hypothetical protein
MEAGEEILQRIITYVIDPSLRVIFTLGLFLFLWGIIEFLWGVKNGEASQKGKDHIVYGLLGMLIMVSVYGIIALIVNSFGLNISSTDVSRAQDSMVGNPFQ